MDNLNEEQIEKLQAIFEIIDQDSDGKITISDLRQMFNSLGDSRTEKDLVTMFEEEDLDFKSSISFAMFLKFMSSKIERMTEIRELREALTVFAKEDIKKQEICEALDDTLEVQEVLNEFCRENPLTGEVVFQKEKYFKKQL
ncbi:BA75_02329T0 [Komagataella pastoris]|uniref:BA75_02329T0 n=1 Tax=Komagataella pastoris TaxID=4922 RepID=A0A1B2JAP0_PICPA|nr:BA75_02329T0 [Komagataella pastoris]